MAGLSVEVLLLNSAVQSLVLVAIATVVRLYLAPRVGLRSLLVDQVGDKQPFWARLHPALPDALGLGVGIGLFLIVLH